MPPASSILKNDRLEKAGLLFNNLINVILKTNLHLHTNDDPKDNVSYTTFQLIDRAKSLGLDVLAISCHQKVVYKKEYREYAEQKGILLIPGIEARIEGKDIVILNCNEDIEKVKTFEELKIYKSRNPQIFVLAPHPFVWSRRSLKSKLLKNINLFDAIELTVFSNKVFNFNKKARAVAEKYNKPLVATSDTHSLKDLNRGYALIEVPTPQGRRDPDRSVGTILSAIKNKNFQNKITPMGLLAMLEFKIKGVWR